jgi:hypothetical protein
VVADVDGKEPGKKPGERPGKKPRSDSTPGPKPGSKRPTRFEKPGLFTTFAGKVERARAPTRNELLDLLGDLALVADRLSPELFFRLRNLIEWNSTQIPFTQEEKDATRWALVTDRLDRMVMYGYDMFAAVSDDLAGTPFAAAPDTIEESYKRIERRKPADQRRKRRGRPRSR